MAGVRQYDGAQIDCWRCGKDRPVEAFYDQPGNPAAMVEMSMRENYGIDVARRNGSVFPVAQSPFLLPLKQAAVNKHLHAGLVERIVARVHKVLGSGHGSGSAKKLNVGHSPSFS